MDYKKLAIGKNEYEYVEFGSGGKPPLLFVPGFSMKPHEHKSLLKGLGDLVDGVTVKLVGVNYLRNQPVTINQVADCISEIANKIYSGKGFYLAAHSTGASGALCAACHEYISPKGLALWSPVTSKKRTTGGLVTAGIKLGLDEVLNKSTFQFGIRHGIFLYDYFRHPVNSWAITRELAHFDYWMTENFIQCKTRIAYSENDEFGFVPNEYDKQVIRSFFLNPKLLKISVKPKLGHLWPRDNPDVSICEIKKLLNSKSC